MRQIKIKKASCHKCCATSFVSQVLYHKFCITSFVSQVLYHKFCAAFIICNLSMVLSVLLRSTGWPCVK